MKKTLALLLTTAILAVSLTGCGESNDATNTSAPTGGNDVVATSAGNKENQPLVIYHISDDEIELHFTSDKLASIERLAFLAPTGDENGLYNPCINIDLIHEGNEMSPVVFVYNKAIDIEYTIDFYGEGVEASVEENTLICHIKHENIIEPFKKAVLWHTSPNGSGLIRCSVSAK